MEEKLVNQIIEYCKKEECKTRVSVHKVIHNNFSVETKREWNALLKNEWKDRKDSNDYSVFMVHVVDYVCKKLAITLRK